MFEDATFHSSRALPTQTPKWMLLALAINLTLLTALVVLPLIYPEGLPAQLLQRVLYVPAPLLPVQQTQPSRTVQSSHSDAPAPSIPLTAPPSTPTGISQHPVGPPPDQSGQMLNLPDSGPGTGTDSIFHSVPPAVQPAQPSRAVVSGGVIEGLLLYETTPTYPSIARTAGISGTVALAATISRSGSIENLRVVSGHPMLRQAALDAVKSWRYRPYLLNNQPVEVETTITIVFSMGNR